VAGQKQPIELILLNGNKHFSKEEIEKRRSEEVKVDNDRVEAPSYLSAKLKQEFNELARELIKVNIMSNLDVDTLARFVTARSMYNKITKTLSKMDVLDDKFATVLNSQDKFFKQCRQTSTDMGLTISSRCKLVIPKKEVKEPSSFDKKFGDV